MDNPALHAPWRMDYIRSLDPAKGSGGCFLCAAAACQDLALLHEALVLWRTPHSLVLMNRYPYANGHLLIAPRRHLGELEDLCDTELMDLQKQTALSVRLLKRAVSAQGFNIGINLGRCAGAGLPGHVHQHVVPRWAGDINFISIIGDVRIIPQAMAQLYQQLIDQRSTCGIEDGL